jgi:hypothetical protein
VSWLQIDWDAVSWSTVFAYAGDALWVISLTVMSAASRTAWNRTKGQVSVRYMGGQGPRAFALWALPVASFAVSLWPAIQARSAAGDMAFIVFGVRAATAPLLALLHLRGLRDSLKP